MPRHSSISSIAALAAAMAFGATPAIALAFHEGGAGQCDGCHTMHAPRSSDYLLGASDPSSVCLSCHADAVQRPYTVLTTASAPGVPPVNYTPGGDFAWLLRTYRWTDGGTQQTSRGERHGHNVVATDFGLLSDTTHLAAPGGTYSSQSLSCVSCHDPHGRYRTTDASGVVSTNGKPIRGSGSYGDVADLAAPTPAGALGVYRLLGGAGYQPAGSGQPAFSASPPVALAPSSYNRGERTNQVRVAYGARMSEWCANCHGAIHTPYAPPASGGLLHVSGASARLGTAAMNIYNSYVKTGDLAGTQASSYLSLVPYEEGTTDRLTLASHARSDGSALEGPRTGLENVTCLSCHRAHASGWDQAMRWNQDSEFVVAAGLWPGIDATGVAASPRMAQGRTMAETRGAMYDRDPNAFAAYQTSLCNKCHAK